MHNDDQNKGMWKRTLRVLTSIKLPIHLYILQVLLGIVSTKIGLKYIPYYTKMQTGDIIGNNVVWLYVAFILLNAIMVLVTAIPKFYANSMVVRNLQNKLIGKILHLPMRDFEQEQASTLITRVTLDTEYANGLITSIIGFITGIAASIMTLSEMSSINNFLSFLVLPIAVYVVLCTIVDGKLKFLMERRQRKSYSSTTAFFSEHTSFLMNIKQLNGYMDEVAMGRAAIKGIFHAEIYRSVLGLFSTFVSGSINTIIAILVFVLGSRMVRNGTLDLNDLVVFYNYILMAYGSLSILPGLYIDLMSSNGTLFYVGRLLDYPEEEYKRESGMDREDQDIVFEHVSFAYEGKEILKDISATIPKGKVTAIAGPNGGGKSTMFKLIERFYTPQEGIIRFGETNVEDIHLNEWRQSIGYVLQKPQLFNGSIRENISYGLEREVKDEEIIEAAKQACAYEFIMDKPEGLDFVIGDNGSRLSEGQKQRIAIARAMMIDPSYLLLDEATCNMDVYSREDVTQALLNLMENRTTVFISHDSQMITKADNVIVLNGGKIEAQGTQESVRKASTTYQRIINGGLS